jgi:CDP-glucose 4,6-dehydratase
MLNLNNIYTNKTVLITGHTGFKGAWLSIWLNKLGAKVIGFSLEKWDNDYLFNHGQLSEKIVDERGDINDLKRIKEIFEKYNPEIVFHLAAQPLVRESYDIPVETFNTNIIGTVNVLECIRNSNSVKAGVMITTDKCYKNKEKDEGYTEEDELGGHDPYSASKACAELVIDSYRKSFFENKYIASVRAGNVIGGGDYSKDRLIPDCVNHIKNNEEIIIRNPTATRPWQHVLEPLYGYLLLGTKLLNGNKQFCQAYNFGPEKESIISVKEIVEKVIQTWGSGNWADLSREAKKHETKTLSLNISKIKNELGWVPKWDIDETIKQTVEWYINPDSNLKYELCLEQIKEYEDKK